MIQISAVILGLPLTRASIICGFYCSFFFMGIIIMGAPILHMVISVRSDPEFSVCCKIQSMKFGPKTDFSLEREDFHRALS